MLSGCHWKGRDSEAQNNQAGTPPHHQSRPSVTSPVDQGAPNGLHPELQTHRWRQEAEGAERRVPLHVNAENRGRGQPPRSWHRHPRGGQRHTCVRWRQGIPFHVWRWKAASETTKSASGPPSPLQVPNVCAITFTCRKPQGQLCDRVTAAPGALRRSSSAQRQEAQGRSRAALAQVQTLALPLAAEGLRPVALLLFPLSSGAAPRPSTRGFCKD